MRRRISGLFAFIFVFACTTVPDSGSDRKLYAPEGDRLRASYIADGAQDMVVTAHPLATKAGFDMLVAGGNAVDAAVAASFAISVVRPQSTGIGGGGFLLYHEAQTRQTSVYDFRERAPGKAKRTMFLDASGNPVDFTYEGQKVPNASLNGHLSVGTPGLVAGLLETHSRHGRLKLATIMEPAIRLAEQGFEIYPELAHAIKTRESVLRVFEGTRQIFFPAGQPLKEGELLVQKDLAWTLRQVATKGRDGFYKGEVAARLIMEMKKGGGIMSARDLDDYRVMKRQPVVGQYRGFKVVSMPPPSSGGVHVIQMLNILENHDVAAKGHNTAEGVQLLTETMRRAYADRARYLGDADFVKVPVKGLTSKDYAKKLSQSIDLSKATRSDQIQAGDPLGYESASTTHLSVVDRWGNGVSTTQTINYTFGSGVVAQGTGVVLNDEMDDFSKKPGVPNAFGLVGTEANAIAARKTMLSSMSPTLVFDETDQLKWLLGSPGGSRIITATLQTIVNLVDHKMSLADAVHANRIHHQWLPDEVYVEKDGLTGDAREKLAAAGYRLSEDLDAVGDVQAIARTPGGWQGVSDTRSTGVPMGR